MEKTAGLIVCMGIIFFGFGLLVFMAKEYIDDRKKDRRIKEMIENGKTPRYEALKRGPYRDAMKWIHEHNKEIKNGK